MASLFQLFPPPLELFFSLSSITLTTLGYKPAHNTALHNCKLPPFSLITEVNPVSKLELFLPRPPLPLPLPPLLPFALPRPGILCANPTSTNKSANCLRISAIIINV